MNNQGQTLALSIMSAIFVLLIGLLIVNFIMPEVTNARINLNCATPDAITDGTKLLCLAIDTTVIYWIILVFSVVIGLITSRLLL